ncbi:MAG: porin [Ramlibacter sp.]
MKKSLIALAVLATAGVASAQSSVTLFGIVDANLAIGKGSGVGSFDRTSMKNSGYNSSRLGFRGTEDLGGGMSASFWIEGALSNDDGNATGLTFQRRSTVSLAGGFGEIRLGRDYTPQFWNLTVFDPFGTNGVGTTQTLNGTASNPATGAGLGNLGGGTTVRANNSFGYFLPRNLGGFYGQAQYYLGEQAQNGAVTEDDGTGYGVRVGYAAGPVNVALAFSKTNATAAGISADVSSSNIGGQYDFGVAKLMAHYARNRVDNGATGKGYLVGGLIPMGAGEIRLAYSRYKTTAAGSPESKKYAIGYVHNLSKRTALYTTYARVSNGGGANSSLNDAVTAANNKSSGFDLGIRHSF